MITYRPGINYVAGWAFWWCLAIVFVLAFGARFLPLRLPGVVWFLLACAAIAALIARLWKCGVSINAEGECSLVTIWRSRCLDTRGGEVLPRKVSLVAQACPVPVLRLADGSEVVFHVLSGCDPEVLDSVERELVKPWDSGPSDFWDE